MLPSDPAEGVGGAGAQVGAPSVLICPQWHHPHLQKDRTDSIRRVKQMFGHMIKEILAVHGFKVRSKSSSARDPEEIFSTSARYEKWWAKTTGDH